MTTKKLSERLQNDEENLLDRRKISRDSREELAEYIHNDEFKLAFKKLFRITTGEEYEEHPPVRDLEGVVELSEQVIDELGDKRIRLDIEIDGIQRGRTFSKDSNNTYRFRQLEEGTYDLEVSVNSVIYYDEDEFEESTEYNFSDDELTIEYSEVTLDTSNSEYNSTITGPTITIENITIGEEIE